jgi:sulfate adenylyltransferase subunit 2
MSLEKLEAKSIYIIREAYAKYRNKLAALVSFGKDSTTMLYLIRKAFFEKSLIPVIHIDTGYKLEEIYEFREKLKKEWKFKLIIAKNTKALENGVSPEKGRFKCCTELKTNALKQVIHKYGFKALLLAIRRDEHGIRAKERYFSPRDSDFRWNYTNQPPELWEQFNEVKKAGTHVRIHPMLHWTELDVWEYIKKNKLPVNPLYFAKKWSDGKWRRYRSLGCKPCTFPIESSAKTIDEIIRELKTTKIAERAGRAQDKERVDMMQKLRSLGYM